MDFIEQLPASEGFSAILVVVDQLTKQVIFIPSHNTVNTLQVAWLFLNHVFSKHGVDGVGALNRATNPNYPDTEPRMSRIKIRTRPSVSGSTVAKTHFSNQNKQMNPLFQKLDRP